MDADLLRARVADGVGQRFLRDADDFGFDAAAERGQLVDGQFDRHVGGEPREIGEARERDADVFGLAPLRAERGDGAARFDHVRAGEIDGDFDGLADAWRKRVGRALRGLQLHQDGGEALRERVVDVAGDAVALFEHRLTPYFHAALLGQPALMEGERGLTRHRLDQRGPPHGFTLGRLLRGERDPAEIAGGSTSGATISESTSTEALNARTVSGRRGSSPVYSTVFDQPGV